MQKNKNQKNGILYVVATPIGNMQDITYRAIKILHTVPLIAAEDTRHTKNLLKNFNIKNTTISLHKYNEHHITNKMLNLLHTKDIALVSNAGTPTIHDPGYHLIKSCHKNNITVVSIPGPCALIAALSVSGISGNNFYYQGFLPKKICLRKKLLTKIKYRKETTIFYESCHRILQSIQDIMMCLGNNRIIVLAKEITKKWEQIKYGTSTEIFSWLKEQTNRQKGEMIIIIKGIKIKKETITKKIHHTLSILLKEVKIKTAIQLTTNIYKIHKNQIYKYIIENFKK
ncbi:16S rRNA (cytidine(1402)-2'-O)-methyltransferase [Buchnera aphidicola]|uniref:Ribosomal RNA small subunit methyltransferase I n=1 Tax=Buchnera aphidicola (Sarucallis kahawaluokalani) TaxID=1241878 RepID=A0A4D6Y896_9GAMM|nr:16S rRNA (cytidine(1402)-2'-O)-methyltransferase [Buchnera aphidicola]QCI25867.1 16S rRNA (cytidine(1402)-2'-O)-methyltransferase [Buchnera aphidicola (Sarucallis kahawaluokalani)]